MKQYNFNLENVRQQVIEFMQRVDSCPQNLTASTLILDGEIHRYSTREDKRGEKSGAYCIHSDGWPAGFVQDWRKGIKEYWKYDVGIASTLTDEQRTYFNSEEFKKKCEDEHKKAEQKRAYRRTVQTEKARQLWDRLITAPSNHPYLLRKNIKPLGVAYNPNTKCLAVPLRNIKGQIMSIQWIPAEQDKHKLFFEGAELNGAFFSYELDTINFPEGYNDFILLGEGFATMAKLHELTHYPVVAAMTCFRLEEVAKVIHDAYPKAKIILSADNDHETEKKRGHNPGLFHADAVGKKGLIQCVIFPDFKPDEQGSDWDDFALLHGDEVTANTLRSAFEQASLPPNIKQKIDQHKLLFTNAQELRNKVFLPIKWAVPGLIPSGLSILGGGPKIGKSIFALNIAVGIAIGGCVLGKINVTQGDVLYLALEDNQRRLKDRILGIPFLNEDDDIFRLTLATIVPRQQEGGLEYIKWWITEHPQARLVIIDTLQKFRKQLSGKGNIYAEDYDVISELKTVADTFDVAILVIHHLKKMSAKENKVSELGGDWVNSFSGSVGLSGSADALFIIKRDRTDSSAKMFRTGRDVEEAEFNLRLDGIGWYLQEDADSFILPTWQKQILDFIKEHGSVTPSELATGYDLNLNTAKSNLRRLEKEGRIKKTGYGKYELNPDYNSK